MLNCAKVAGSDSTCYRLNVKVTAAEPSPVVEEGKLPPSTSSRAAHGTTVRQSRKKLSFVNDETRPHGEHSHQVTTASSPLESYVSSQQEVLKHYHRDLTWKNSNGASKTFQPKLIHHNQLRWMNKRCP